MPLTTKKKYRQFIAIILMALYAFVATPVQFWHHHKDEQQSGVTRQAEKNDAESLSSSAGKSLEGNCETCSHKFSSYNEGATIIFAAPVFYPVLKAGFYYSLVPSSPLFRLSNKGPPALA
ncbi:hypothetical protein [Flavihumibacter sp.]|uniref:hypothetical protein n=1 Tax=Flavihumibacter sp. TaxID=1913981 RepID=UPI002FCA428A